MGRETFPRTSYRSATKAVTGGSTERVTRAAEQQAQRTGKLDPLVDPAGYGVIRESRPRFEQRPNGLWELLVGVPVPVESRVDTTGSMGDNVDVAFRVLPNMYEGCSEVLPGCDLHVATGIFGDVSDNFILCRPQFEMQADKIVQQLTLMVPEKDGGDFPEDPHYGLFAGAYLTKAYLHKIGLKSYDFTVSDATARDRLDERHLIRVFGDQVFEKVTENGHKLDTKSPYTQDVVNDLLRHAHAFFLQVENQPETTRFWTNIFGSERVVKLPSTELLPQVQAVIIGLTEGTLELDTVVSFLQRHNVGEELAREILRSVAHIPIGAQAALPNFAKRPQKGDLFREKTDLWPISPDEVKPGEAETASAEGELDWL